MKRDTAEKAKAGTMSVTKPPLGIMPKYEKELEEL